MRQGEPGWHHAPPSISAQEEAPEDAFPEALPKRRRLRAVANGLQEARQEAANPLGKPR